MNPEQLFNKVAEQGKAISPSLFDDGAYSNNYVQ